MGFRISSNCKGWFAHLAGEEPLKFIFDYYYLCAIIGIAARHKRDPDANAEEFIEDFIAPYKPYQRRLIALLALAYLDDIGVGLREKDKVAQKFADLVTTETSSNLTEKGFKLMNAYAAGGFEILNEEMEKPRDIVFFLAKYCQLLKKKSGDNPYLSGDVDTVMKGSKAKI